MMTFQMAPHKEHVIWMWRHRVLIQDVFRRFTHNFPIGKTTNLTESILIPYRRLWHDAQLVDPRDDVHVIRGLLPDHTYH